jgi:hypothetical protein
MKKGIWAILLAMALLFVSPLSIYAARVRVFVGPSIGWGYPGWYWRGPVGGWPYAYPYPYPYPYSSPYPYYAPPPAVMQQPPVYSEPEQQQPYYWYYCQDPQGYYPYVKSCPGGWMKVVPNTTPPQPGGEGMGK